MRVMSAASWMMLIGVIGTLLCAVYVAVTPPRTTVIWRAMSGEPICRSVEQGPTSTGHRLAAAIALLSVIMVLLAATGAVAES